MNKKIIDIIELSEKHEAWTSNWHTHLVCGESTPLLAAIEENHRHNFELWHEEDIARRDDLPAARIKDAKRKIDKCNQARNNAMERMDDWFLNALAADSVRCEDGVLHSETPGMMIDRLSIMALKAYHMREQVERSDVSAEHRAKCAARVQVLVEQQLDLRKALETLVKELFAGRRRFKIYRQFKMYNDPELNPQLYRTTVAQKT